MSLPFGGLLVERKAERSGGTVPLLACSSIRKPAKHFGLAGFLIQNYLAKKLSQSALVRST